jgi:hypothetical protein
VTCADLPPPIPPDLSDLVVSGVSPLVPAFDAPETSY